jgi:hypothetical protein
MLCTLCMLCMLTMSWQVWKDDTVASLGQGTGLPDHALAAHYGTMDQYHYLAICRPQDIVGAAAVPGHVLEEAIVAHAH